MSCEFPRVPLGEAPVQIIDGDRGKNYPSQGDFTNSGYCLFLNAGNVTSNGFDFSSCMFISQERDALLNKGKLNRNDVILTTRGTVGNSALFGSGVPFEHLRINSGMVILRPDERVVDCRFLYQFVRSDFFLRQVEALCTGSAQPQLPIRDIKKIELPQPSLTEQKAIAHIIGTIDEKIEMNRKTTETLEAIAKALFKSWFVDFDPVRAKAEGRPTSLPADIGALFPMSLIDSTEGEVPANWLVNLLQDEATVLTRGISPAYCDADGVRVINQKCIRDRKVDLSKARLHDASRKSIGGRSVARYDALVNSTGVGTLGRVAMMPAVEGEVTVDSHVTIVRGKSAAHSLYLAYTLMNREAEVERLGEGSTGQTELSRARLGGMSILIPPPPILQAFFDQIGPIEDKREQLAKETLTLAAIRDTLLPKLISGELRIPIAKTVLEKVVAKAEEAIIGAHH